jgi:hypothetical protein
MKAFRRESKDEGSLEQKSLFPLRVVEETEDDF